MTLTYLPATGPLAGAKQINLHHGVNGWKESVDTPMRKTDDATWEVAIGLRPETRQMDFVFTDGSKWDNNSGLDWHVALDKTAAR